MDLPEVSRIWEIRDAAPLSAQDILNRKIDFIGTEWSLWYQYWVFQSKKPSTRHVKSMIKIHKCFELQVSIFNAVLKLNMLSVFFKIAFFSYLFSNISLNHTDMGDNFFRKSLKFQ